MNIYNILQEKTDYYESNSKMTYNHHLHSSFSFISVQSNYLLKSKIKRNKNKDNNPFKLTLRSFKISYS